MIPGLVSIAGSSDVYISESANNVDLNAYIGSPASPVRIRVAISNGVTLGSTSISTYALRWDTLPSGSIVTLVNNGRIQGKGGDGGRGGSGAVNSSSNSRYGGGGGGVGSIGGTGGTATSPATAGGDGGSEVGSGGAFGSSVNMGSPQTYDTGDEPERGGDALYAGGIQSVIYNAAGEIWGGGAGGIGGHEEQFTTLFTQTAGADPGEDTFELDIPSGIGLFYRGGYSVVGSNFTIEDGGSSPNLRGSTST